MQTTEYDNARNPELVTIREFGDMSEALVAQGCLHSAGIPAFLTNLNMTRLEWPLTRGVKLQVDVDDAETAIGCLEPSAAE